MNYRLKKTEGSIRIVDGPYAGRKYMKGRLYDDIPPEEAHRFEKIKDKEKPKVKNEKPLPELKDKED